MGPSHVQLKAFQWLCISSMEDSAIREGFDHPHPGSGYAGPHQATLCRQKADWLVSINTPRLSPVLHGQTLNIGHVTLLTLALIVRREAEAAALEPVPFYTVKPACGDKPLPEPKVGLETISKTARFLITSIDRYFQEISKERVST